MSDIPDTGSFNLGLANIAASNYGPNAITSQANTAANTQNVQAATQGQQIQNANAALNLQALRIGLSQLYKMPGWQAGQSTASDTQADQSGTSTQSRSTAPSSASSGGAALSPAQSGGASSGEDDEVGESVSHPELLDTSLRNQFYINPLGTPEEQQNILAAARVSALTKNPAYVQIATTQRDMAVGQRRQQAQQTANTHYSEMASVADAGDKGNAFDVLQAVAPESAGKIERMHPQEAGESDADYKARLSEVSADTAAHYAGHVFQYTGRETEIRKDGVPVDKATGFPVAGVRGSGMSPQEYSEAIDKANAPVTVKNSDNSESQIPTWKYAQQQGMPVKSAADYVKQKVDEQQEISQHKQAVQDHLTAQRTQQQIAQGGAPGAAPGQPGAPAAQRPPSTPEAGAAAMSARMLPGPDGAPINLDTMPKVNLPAPVSGRTANPQEQAQLDAFKENYKGMQTDAMRKLSETNQADALLTPFQQKLNAINPRDVGPGSPAYKALLDFKSAITGKAPDDLVDMGVIDKFANQLGVQNVRQLLSGQRITNQEMMNFLTRASASVTQPLDVMKTIVSYQKANNDFDRKLATTQLAGLSKHVDPAALQGLENGREAYVAQSMKRDGFGGAPQPTRPGQQSSGAAPETRTYQGKTYVLTPGAPRNAPSSWKAQ